MVNEHTLNNINLPKNIEALTNNTKMSSTNGEVINNDEDKFEETCFSSLSSLDFGRLQSQFQSAQPSSMRSPFTNSSSLSPGDSFTQTFSQSYLDNLLNSGLWGSPIKSAQNQTSSPFNDLLGHRTTSPFNDVAGNHIGTKSVGEIGSGLTNGNIDNSNADNLFGLSPFHKRNDSRDIWHNGRNASSNFFSNNHNGHTSNVLSNSSITNATNSTTKPTLNSSSGLFDWPTNSSVPNNPWQETWPQTFGSVNSEPRFEANNKISDVSLEEFKKLLSSNNSNDKSSGLLNRNNATASAWNTIYSEFDKYITTMLSSDVFLCDRNFQTFTEMLQKDLKKFEASTFTLEELELFQKIYSSFVKNSVGFIQEKIGLEDNYEVFSAAMKNIALSIATGSTIDTDDVDKVKEKLTSSLNVLYSAKYNYNFLNLVKFYRGIIYSVPTDILNNLPLIIEQSKLLATNSGNPADPLFMAYRNLVDELDKYNNRPQVNESWKNNTIQQNEHQHKLPNSQGSVHDENVGSNNSTVMTLNENKDMNNNKEFEKLKYAQQLAENENNLKSLSITKQPSVPPVFSNISHLKVEPSVYMPHYYPVNHHMFSLHGPIVTFGTKIRSKNNAPYYMTPNRQTLEIVVDTELTKSISGAVVFEKSEHLQSNKAFNKLVARVKKHFPNVPIKTLVDLIIQAKYAIMKKYRIQYGFSGFKIKELVKYIVEHICETANPSLNTVYDSTKDRKGVSWSKVASVSNQPNAHLLMSSNVYATKDNSSATSSVTSSSPSPSPVTLQNCAFCKSPVSNVTSDENKKLTLISCSHVFHNQCIEFLTKAKVKPVCPICDQLILLNEEFPSL